MFWFHILSFLVQLWHLITIVVQCRWVQKLPYAFSRDYLVNSFQLVTEDIILDNILSLQICILNICCLNFPCFYKCSLKAILKLYLGVVGDFTINWSHFAAGLALIVLLLLTTFSMITYVVVIRGCLSSDTTSQTWEDLPFSSSGFLHLLNFHWHFNYEYYKNVYVFWYFFSVVLLPVRY